MAYWSEATKQQDQVPRKPQLQLSTTCNTTKKRKHKTKAAAFASTATTQRGRKAHSHKHWSNVMRGSAVSLSAPTASVFCGGTLKETAFFSLSRLSLPRSAR